MGVVLVKVNARRVSRVWGEVGRIGGGYWVNTQIPSSPTHLTLKQR